MTKQQRIKKLVHAALRLLRTSEAPEAVAWCTEATAVLKLRPGRPRTVDRAKIKRLSKRLPMAEVAAVLGVSRQRIQQVLATAD